MLRRFLFLLGIAILLAWAAIRLGPPLLALLLAYLGEVAAAWGKAVQRGLGRRRPKPYVS